MPGAPIVTAGPSLAGQRPVGSADLSWCRGIENSSPHHGVKEPRGPSAQADDAPVLEIFKGPFEDATSAAGRKRYGKLVLAGDCGQHGCCTYLRPGAVKSTRKQPRRAGARSQDQLVDRCPARHLLGIQLRSHLNDYQRVSAGCLSQS